VNPVDQLAAAIAATIEMVGGPWDGKLYHVTGPVRWRCCWYDNDDPNTVHIYELARDPVNGQAVYQYRGVARDA
jgi:hypothetical protein